VKVQGS